MLKERVLEMQVEIQKLKHAEEASSSIKLIMTLQDKVAESDKHLRMTLDRLTDQHQKCQKLEALLQTKDNQVISCLEIAERVSKHLARMQQEDKLWKLDKFNHEEFESNMTVLQLIKMERTTEENELKLQ